MDNVLSLDQSKRKAKLDKKDFSALAIVNDENKERLEKERLEKNILVIKSYRLKKTGV